MITRSDLKTRMKGRNYFLLELDFKSHVNFVFLYFLIHFICLVILIFVFYDRFRLLHRRKNLFPLRSCAAWIECAR